VKLVSTHVDRTAETPKGFVKDEEPASVLFVRWPMMLAMAALKSVSARVYI